MAGELGLEPRLFRSKGGRVTNYTTPQCITNSTKFEGRKPPLSLQVRPCKAKKRTPVASRGYIDNVSCQF